MKQGWGTEGRSGVEKNLGFRGASHRVGTQTSEEPSAAQGRQPGTGGDKAGSERGRRKQEIGTSSHFQDKGPSLG